MSPRPAAPRMASVRACATASASECPTSPREYGISTPPRISFLPSPSANRCESYPIPTRMSGVEDADRERSEEHTSELQSPCNLVCRLLLEKKKTTPPHT